MRMTASLSIQVDGRSVEAVPGERLLPALLRAGIWIPHLCHFPGREPPDGSCRLCFVQITGWDRPVTACSAMVEENMQVQTRTPEVDRLVASGFAMIMSTHRLDCKQCPGNRRCALQEIAKKRKLPLRPKRLPKIEPDWPIDDSRSDLGINPNHCVLCGRCIHVCNQEVNKGILDYAHRGLKTVVSTFDGEPLAGQDCGDCTRCADVCPVGAIYRK